MLTISIKCNIIYPSSDVNEIYGLVTAPSLFTSYDEVITLLTITIGEM